MLGIGELEHLSSFCETSETIVGNFYLMSLLWSIKFYTFLSFILPCKSNFANILPIFQASSAPR